MLTQVHTSHLAEEPSPHRSPNNPKSAPLTNKAAAAQPSSTSGIPGTPTDSATPVDTAPGDPCTPHPATLPLAAHTLAPLPLAAQPLAPLPSAAGCPVDTQQHATASTAVQARLLQANASAAAQQDREDSLAEVRCSKDLHSKDLHSKSFAQQKLCTGKLCTARARCWCMWRVQSGLATIPLRQVDLPVYCGCIWT